MKRYEEVDITGYFGPGALACTKAPRIDGFPPMTAHEQQLWCEQQFTVTAIDAAGPDPVIAGSPAPLPTPAWTAPPGVQPLAGDGWRLLASADWHQVALTVRSETVDVAIDAVDYQRLWLSMARGEAPAVDFTREFVVQFGPPVSSTCPWIAFTGIGVDHDQDLLYGQFENLSAHMFTQVTENFGCTTDAVPHAFLVAIERSVAPASIFQLRLFQEHRCVDCGWTDDEIRVDLGS